MPYDPVRDCFIEGATEPPKRPSPRLLNATCFDEQHEISETGKWQKEPRTDTSIATHHPNTLLERKPKSEIKERDKTVAAGVPMPNLDEDKHVDNSNNDEVRQTVNLEQTHNSENNGNNVSSSVDKYPIKEEKKVTPKRPRDKSLKAEHVPEKKAKGLDGNAAIVASHYNARPEVGVEKRKESSIWHLKAFNNWTKSVLIGKFSCRDASVLDMGCGKGGDLLKWSKARIRQYVGLDLAEISVLQARDRYEGMREKRFHARFHALDCYVQDISTLFANDPAPPEFDMVSMQFCLHYSFETETKALRMIKNVSKYLKKGGRFIGTMPYDDFIFKRIKYLADKQEKESPGAQLKCASFGNSIYEVKLDEENTKKALTSPPPSYGLAYTYYLEDAVDKVPEWVVQWKTLKAIAKEENLYPIYHEPFHEVYYAEKDDKHFGPLLDRMKVKSGTTRISKDEWEAAGLYVAFAFEKR